MGLVHLETITTWGRKPGRRWRKLWRQQSTKPQLDKSMLDPLIPRNFSPEFCPRHVALCNKLGSTSDGWIGRPGPEKAQGKRWSVAKRWWYRGILSDCWRTNFSNLCKHSRPQSLTWSRNNRGPKEYTKTEINWWKKRLYHIKGLSFCFERFVYSVSFIFQKLFLKLLESSSSALMQMMEARDR